MELSKRLCTLLNLIPQKSVVADVGSDHGKLIISLIQDNIIEKGYAIENKEGPYSILKGAIVKNGLENVITPLFSDGISQLPEDVNCIVIAGMGGANIVKIIKQNSEKLKNVQTIVIDAHTCIPLIRKEISNLGYFIEQEMIIDDKKIIYELIRFKKGEKIKYSELELTFGPLLMKEKNKIFCKKWLEYQKKIQKTLLFEHLPISRKERLNQFDENIKQILNMEE